jgi:hypothetical protein
VHAMNYIYRAQRVEEEKERQGADDA